MRFEKAVCATGLLKEAYRKGLQALTEADRNHISCSRPRDLAGSVNLDRALAGSHPNAPRWDYGIGIKAVKHSDRVFWVEVHPAAPRHVQTVIDKRNWLLHWLENSAPLLAKLPRELVWVASGV